MDKEINELKRYLILSSYRDGDYFLLEEYEELQSILKTNKIAQDLEDIRYKYLIGLISQSEYYDILNNCINELKLKKIYDIDSQIHKCNLCENNVEHFNSKTISFNGNNSSLVIVGEAPSNNGWKKSGIAWHDINNNLIPSGVVMQRLLKIIDYDLDDTCFLEAVKCYPKDRNNLKECSRNCKKYLLEQLNIIEPKIVLSLGDTATKSLLDIKYSRFKEVVGKCYYFNGYEVIPIYHPSPISPLSFKGNETIFENVIKDEVKKLIRK